MKIRFGKRTDGIGCQEVPVTDDNGKYLGYLYKEYGGPQREWAANAELEEMLAQRRIPHNVTDVFAIVKPSYGPPRQTDRFDVTKFGWKVRENLTLDQAHAYIRAQDKLMKENERAKGRNGGTRKSRKQGRSAVKSSRRANRR